MSISARLDLRLSALDKDRIARAAALRGLPVSAFVRNAVLREADAALAAGGHTVTLSPEESRRVLAVMEEPIESDARLKEAMEHGVSLTLDRGQSLAARLRARATARLSTEEIMRLTRDA